jgi:Domain of unknown function (DUF4397)
MKKVNFLKSSALLLATCLLVFSSSSCTKDDPAPTVADSAKAIIVHASPDAPGVNISLDGAVVTALGTLEFTKSTPYTALPASKDIKVGVRLPAATADVVTANLKLGKDSSYTVLAINKVATLGFLLFNDTEFLKAPAAGKAKVRFIHASPDAPAVDIYVKGTTPTKIFSNAAFKSGSVIEATASTVDLEVRLAGGATAVLTVPGVPLVAGKIYTIFAYGLTTPAVPAQGLGAAIIANN